MDMNQFVAEGRPQVLNLSLRPHRIDQEDIILGTGGSVRLDLLLDPRSIGFNVESLAGLNESAALIFSPGTLYQQLSSRDSLGVEAPDKFVCKLGLSDCDGS